MLLSKDKGLYNSALMNFISNTIARLTPVLGNLEANPLKEMMTKEVVGINAPKIAVTRSWDERLDVATFEIGNTLASVVPTLALDQVLKRTLYTPGMSGSALKWARVAHSSGVLLPLAGLMWAIPYIRNYLTTKRTGKIDFADVISETASNGMNDPQLSTEKKQLVAENLKETRNNIFKILGTAGALAVLGIAGGKWAVARQLNMGKITQKLADWFTFKFDPAKPKEGGFMSITKPAMFLFWGAASYFGAMLGSRDKYELREQLLKFGAFNFGFFAPGWAFNKLFNPKFKAVMGDSLFNRVFKAGGDSIKYDKIQSMVHNSEVKKAANKLWTSRNVTSLFTSIFLLGVLPQVVNIFLTKKRMEKEGVSGAGNPALQPQQTQQLKQIQNHNFQQFLNGVSTTQGA